MKKLKSHFWYTKDQRNGILLLVLFILVLQAIYVFVDFSSKESLNINTPELLAFQSEIDSLKKLEIESRKPKVYSFNPNFITDFKGYQLGMSVDEIDRLHNFRKQNNFVNSTKEFQRVTKVSDRLLNKIAPYFKFPNWVAKKNKETKNVVLSGVEKLYVEKELLNKTISTTDINKATASDFAIIDGIDEKLSKRIIKYRSKLQGFTYNYQLNEVWGINPAIVKNILQKFKILERPIIQKINVNTASFKEVLRNPYINYELCKKIFSYKDEIAEFQKISELKKINGFPTEKYDRIILYLEAK